VLSDLDPLYHQQIDGKNIQLPMLFWKIVMYGKSGKLYALGFMMSHQELMEKSGLIKPVPVMRAEVTATEDKIYFNDYKHSEPYQVKVEQIEELAGITLMADQPIIKPFQKDVPIEVLVKDVNVRFRAPGERRMLSELVYPNMVTA
jgi:endonuclease G, mitochondrial